jgi:hypothetical protein
MILGFNKHAWRTQLFYKVERGYNGFKGENLRKAKRLR